MKSPFDRAPWFGEASRRRRWLAGVSGGADSVAMLHLLVEAGFRNIVVCHLNHGLRGRTAAEDAKFVARLADSLGLPCEMGRADVRARMATRGESLETAARHARHAFFAECAGKWKCRRLLLAHHADDQAETVLWNLLRGSHGLKGMRQEQMLATEVGVTLEIHRPLLEMRRAKLAEWLTEREFRWREDASNAEPIAVRNRLRNEAFPLLDAISGRDAAASLARAAADAEDAEELGKWAVERADVLDPHGRLHLPAMRELPVVVRRLVLREFLRSRGVMGIDRDLLDRGLALLDPDGPPAVNLPGGGALRRRAGRLVLEI